MGAGEALEQWQVEDAQHTGEDLLSPNLLLTWDPVMDSVLIADFSFPGPSTARMCPLRYIV